MNLSMTFGMAIDALKRGEKVARAGWNGKGMWLWLKPATEVTRSQCCDPVLRDITERHGGTVKALGTICMYTHDASGRSAVLSGWLASQSDMLAEDWYIVSDCTAKRAIDNDAEGTVVIVHKGLAAHQVMEQNMVNIVQEEKIVRTIHIDNRKRTVEELKAYIEDYLKTGNR